jgi:hypothetical protein
VKEVRSITAPCCGESIDYTVDLTAGPVRELLGCPKCSTSLVFFVGCYANGVYTVAAEVRKAS